MARRKKTEQTDTAMTPVVLTGVLDVSTAQQLQQNLTNALDVGGPLRLDAAQVERVDASALQLLYACMRTAAARGMACSWGETSEALVTAADLCGLRDSLGLAGPAA